MYPSVHALSIIVQLSGHDDKGVGWMNTGWQGKHSKERVGGREPKQMARQKQGGKEHPAKKGWERGNPKNESTRFNVNVLTTC